MKSETDKKPVLTSPWKIGLFVSLMLIVVSFGVGYYLVSEYSIDLKWLSASTSSWKIDSFLFFKEIYPLLSAVVILALFSYFVITSAVRRYKSFLDSGQDYRKMISLAESIDDLTNPAQIARLSDYPELQGVLRNYGDQIREISAEIEKEKESSDVSEFESVVRSLLSGEIVDEESTRNKWWSAIFDELKGHIDRMRKSMEELRKKRGSSRMIAGKAALQSGRMKEEVRMINEAVAKMRGSLVGMKSGLNGKENAHQSAPAQSHTRDQGVWLSDMEDSIKRLREMGNNFDEFANQNNNLALNVALMAAKGTPAEGELADLAERIRSSAEGFNRLSKQIVAISDQMMSGYFAVKENVYGAPTQSQSSGDNMDSETVDRLLDSMANLEEKTSEIIDELNELEAMLQDEVRSASFDEASEQPLSAPAPRDGEREQAVREASGILKSEFVSNDDDNGGLVFDKQEEWGDEGSLDLGSNFDSQQDVAADNEISRNEGSISLESTDFEEPQDFARERTLSMENADPSPELDRMDAGVDTVKEQVDISEGENEKSSASDDSWMEMPGHRWVKIDVEGSDDGVDEKVVQVEVSSSTAEANDAIERQDAFEEPVQKESPESPVSSRNRTESSDVDGEPVYDLFELGAVEYVEKSEQKL
ncbi:MAG: hypothetical protein B6D63_00285 [Candidatus Latescibacteria bacterium 4484_7]|nr:MAG: hypothetical protein B6D63_00285 [Candidatus Latescibacteria bacterium 4484_7]